MQRVNLNAPLYVLAADISSRASETWPDWGGRGHGCWGSICHLVLLWGGDSPTTTGKPFLLFEYNDDYRYFFSSAESAYWLANHVLLFPEQLNWTFPVQLKADLHTHHERHAEHLGSHQWILLNLDTRILWLIWLRTWQSLSLHHAMAKWRQHWWWPHRYTLAGI